MIYIYIYGYCKPCTEMNIGLAFNGYIVSRNYFCVSGWLATTTCLNVYVICSYGPTLICRTFAVYIVLTNISMASTWYLGYVRFMPLLHTNTLLVVF